MVAAQAIEVMEVMEEIQFLYVTLLIDATQAIESTQVSEVMR